MRGKRTDLLGHRFGRLTVIENAGRVYGSPTSAIALWKCRCECGKEVTTTSAKLKRGRFLSCGCLRNRHGHNKRGKRTRTYGAWTGMLSRCEKPSNPSFGDYGGRGITVCDRWHEFDNFLEDMGACPPGKSIERRNNDGNYEPSNCYWATPTEQANNKRRTVRVSFGGEEVPIAILATRFGLCPNIVYERIVRYGWSVDDAITTQVSPRTPHLKFTYKGKEYKLTELAKISKVSKATLYQRLVKLGWPVEEAVDGLIGARWG